MTHNQVQGDDEIIPPQKLSFNELMKVIWEELGPELIADLESQRQEKNNNTSDGSNNDA